MENSVDTLPAPPSAKIILKLIRERKIMKFEDIKAETGLSKRALLYAIKTLRELDLIETQVCMGDTRRRFYCIKLR